MKVPTDLKSPEESSDRLEIARKKVPTEIQVARNKIQVPTNRELSPLLSLKRDILTVRVSISDGKFPLYWLASGVLVGGVGDQGRQAISIVTGANVVVVAGAV